MIGKLICASMLVTSSVPVFAQDPSRASADMFIKFRSAHACTVTPGADWYAINTKGTGTSTGRVAMNAAWSRINLMFTASPPSTAGGVPTISGHAINTKGTGTSSGRMAADVAVSCTGTAIGADDASQKVNVQDISLTTIKGWQGLRWSCSVTGTEDAPQFVLTLLVPTILGQAERSGKPGKGAGRSEWSWGTSSSSGHRVSIVPRGSKVAGSSLVACAAKDKPMTHNWDLATNTKM